jgi:hypothetical protein
MGIEKKGEFILINKSSIRIDQIIAAKPQSIVQVDYNGKIINKDYPKIIVTTRDGIEEFIYITDKKRDEELRQINEIIGTHQVKNEIHEGSTTINVSNSTGVNIISNSKKVSISQKNINEAKGILAEMKHHLENNSEIDQELKEDVYSIISEVESQISDEHEVKRHSFRSLLGVTSEIATVGGLAIQLGQLLGYI